MTCEVAGGQRRKLQRQEQDAGWLNNEFFWEAFKGALAASGQSAMDDARAEDGGPHKPTQPQNIRFKWI